eukprot:1146957-Pelagomonas_calceolata.AAC.7
MELLATLHIQAKRGILTLHDSTQPVQSLGALGHHTALDPGPRQWPACRVGRFHIFTPYLASS